MSSKSALDTFRHALNQIENGKSLSRSEASAALSAVMDQPTQEPAPISPELLAGFLKGLKVKGESVSEVAGFLDAISARAVRVPWKSDHCIDVCGTGGDGSQSFNVSTTVALVLAACGLPVAKHGNRSVSSRSGSFDVLEALGIAAHNTPQVAVHALERFGIAFLFAPSYHPILKIFGPTRKQLGVATVFNIMGPLLNPVTAVKQQLIGVYEPRLLDLVSQVAKERGLSRAIVVHGLWANEQNAEPKYRGLDEISRTGPSQYRWLKNTQIESGELAPADFGLETLRSSNALRGGSAQENAQIIEGIFQGNADGEMKSKREVVLMNAAASLVLAEKANSWKEGMDIAAHAIDSGKCRELVTQLRAFDPSQAQGQARSQ